MKPIHLIFAIVFTSCFTAMVANSQQVTGSEYKNHPHWVDMMQDRSINFYETQKAFEAYWEDREVTKGSGWKPFKRWEWYWESRVNPDGTWPAPDKTWNEYFKYLELHPDARSSSGDWECLGPFHIPGGEKGYKGLGRINAIAFHPSDPQTVFIGAPAGGLWRTDDGGGNWVSYTDNLPTLGVSSIVVDYSDFDRILMGTGDRDAGDAYGLGVMLSTDGGVTWSPSGNGMGDVTVGRMIQHPVLPGIIYAATSSGIFKSTDSGENWTMKKPGGFKEIVFKPGDPSTLYAAAGAGFYKSADDGENWYQVTSGLQGGNRGVIAVTPANPDFVYFLVTNSDSFKGLWRSTDSGENFEVRSTTPNIMSWGCNGGNGGQAWYDLDIAADPLNQDVIFAGGVNCFKSVDGGVTWDISSHWWGDCNVPAVHADLHAMEYNPVDGRLYAANDGGIYWTDDGGTSWIEITDGLPISQVYKIGQSKTDIDKVINGYQDNGTSTYLGNNWLFTHGGDGMECAVDHTDPAYTYATLYYGSIYRKYNNGSSYQIAGDGVHGITESGGWITPFCLHEGDANIMFAGYKNLWRAEGIKGNNFTWKKITDIGGNNLDVVEHSPANHDVFYYSWNNHMYVSENVMDDVPAWTDLTQMLPGSEHVRDIEAHPYDENIVWMSQGSKVYYSENKGHTWTDISGTLPGISMNSLAYYLNSQNGIYAASDAGVWYRDDNLTDWVMFSNGLPVDASINEIEIYHNPANPAEDVIRAGTYGRGMWSSDMWHDTPVADFEADLTEIPVGYTVQFTDLSSGVPTSWDWAFEGGTPASSDLKDPQIQYLTQGVFEVSLTVENSEGSDTKTISGYITVGETTQPEVYFTSSDSITCSGKAVQFTDLSLNFPVEWEWSFDPNTVTWLNGTGQNSQHPEVSFDAAGIYSVTLTATNTAGSGTLTREDYMHIGGIALPFTDDFESGTLETHSWSVENPDYDVTWEVNDIGGLHGQSAWMNFFDYIVPPGERDRLISPILNFSGYSQVGLSFIHAYAKRHAATDSLIVYISPDCGENWQRIFEGGDDGTGSFATHELMTDPFTPVTAEDWCGTGYGAQCTYIDLSGWAGFENMQIMFETYNYYGNNLYLDNILIGPFMGTAAAIDKDHGFSVYPNPSDGSFNIVPGESEKAFTIEVFDMQGRKVFRSATATGKDGVYPLDLSDQGRGIYFLRMVSGAGTYTTKLVIE